MIKNTPFCRIPCLALRFHNCTQLHTWVTTKYQWESCFVLPVRHNSIEYLKLTILILLLDIFTDYWRALFHFVLFTIFHLSFQMIKCNFFWGNARRLLYQINLLIWNVFVSLVLSTPTKPTWRCHFSSFIKIGNEITLFCANASLWALLNKNINKSSMSRYRWPRAIICLCL